MHLGKLYSSKIYSLIWCFDEGVGERTISQVDPISHMVMVKDSTCIYSFCLEFVTHLYIDEKKEYTNYCDVMLLQMQQKMI